ncbi:hypothetical protein Q1695_009677 [Nippostrongylus brasiliensis]|nr:hypothetical protein Q1695_009677 [Nippostrongylus brasiliensis]
MILLRRPQEPQKLQERRKRGQQWAFYVDSFKRTVDCLYEICRSDHNINGCKEAIIYLENSKRDFESLINTIKVETSWDESGRPQAVAWEIRKTTRSPVQISLESMPLAGILLQKGEAGSPDEEDDDFKEAMRLSLDDGWQLVAPRRRRSTSSSGDVAPSIEDRANDIPLQQPEAERLQCDSAPASERNPSVDRSLQSINEVGECDELETVPADPTPTSANRDNVIFSSTRSEPAFGEVSSLLGLDDDVEWREMTEEEESLALEEHSLNLEIEHEESFSIDIELERQVAAEAEALEKFELSQKASFLANKVEEVREKRQKVIERKRQLLESRMERAQENREKNITEIVRKAKDDEQKVLEVQFINSLQGGNMLLDLRMRDAGVEERKQTMAEERARRMEEKAAKEHAAEERRKLAELERIARLQEIAERKEARHAQLAAQRNEQERLRSEKRKQQQEKLTELRLADAEENESLRKRIQEKIESSSRRHEQNLEDVRVRAQEFSSPRPASGCRLTWSLVDSNLWPSDVQGTVFKCVSCNSEANTELEAVAHVMSKSHLLKMDVNHQTVSTEELEKEFHALIQSPASQSSEQILDDDPIWRKKRLKVKQRLAARNKKVGDVTGKPPASNTRQAKCVRDLVAIVSKCQQKHNRLEDSILQSLERNVTDVLREYESQEWLLTNFSTASCSSLVPETLTLLMKWTTTGATVRLLGKLSSMLCNLCSVASLCRTLLFTPLLVELMDNVILLLKDLENALLGLLNVSLEGRADNDTLEVDVRRARLALRTLINAVNRSKKFGDSVTPECLTLFRTLIRIPELHTEAFAALVALARPMRIACALSDAYVTLIGELVILWESPAVSDSDRSWISALISIHLEEDFGFLASHFADLPCEEYTALLHMTEVLMDSGLGNSVTKVHPNNISFCVDLLQRILYDFGEGVSVEKRLPYVEQIAYAVEIIASAALREEEYSVQLLDRPTAIESVVDILESVLDAQWQDENEERSRPQPEPHPDRPQKEPEIRIARVMQCKRLSTLSAAVRDSPLEIRATVKCAAVQWSIAALRHLCYQCPKNQQFILEMDQKPTGVIDRQKLLKELGIEVEIDPTSGAVRLTRPPSQSQ